MAALSRHFADTVIKTPVGNPQNEDRSMTLWHKVQSELNLANQGQMVPSEPLIKSIDLGSAGSTGDSSLDEAIASTSTCMQLAAERDAFIELRELGTLVAERRGLEINGFLEGLTRLLSNKREVDTHIENADRGEMQLSPSNDTYMTRKPHVKDTLTPRQTLRRYRSQPQSGSYRKYHRHFSFEPGDDQLQTLEEELKPHKAKGKYGQLIGSNTPPVHGHRPSLQSQVVDSILPLQTLAADFQKPSKIPSPVQTMGRLRGENSTSSLHLFSAKSNEDRREF